MKKHGVDILGRKPEPKIPHPRGYERRSSIQQEDSEKSRLKNSGRTYKKRAMKEIGFIGDITYQAAATFSKVTMSIEFDCNTGLKEILNL